jgi:hypothetical protein
LDGKDAFRGTTDPFGGKGGRESSGDIRPLTNDGRRPGCDDARFLPIPKLVAVLAGNDDAVSFGPAGAEVVDVMESVGEESVLGGADAFDRLWEMVPIVGDELIKYDGAAPSARVDDEETRERETILEERGEGGTISVEALRENSGKDGKAGRGESRFAIRGVSGRVSTFASDTVSFSVL